MIQIRGRILGRYRPAGSKDDTGYIVHVTSELRPSGPAENAFVFVEILANEARKARYVSWINVFDIEYAALDEPGAWHLMDGDLFQESVGWFPYGWGGPRLPNIGYLQITAEPTPIQPAATQSELSARRYRPA
jgi:hypothetical protein